MEAKTKTGSSLIDTTELRIGNIVLVNGEMTKVKNILDFCINMTFNKWSGDRDDEIAIDEVFPVVLTEEILIKCGLEFKQYGQSDNTKHISFWDYDCDDLLTIEFDPIHGIGIMLFEDGFNIHHNRIILYLHQFQNIIFELTGKELLINL
jgi:hypothetical protein